LYNIHIDKAVNTNASRNALQTRQQLHLGLGAGKSFWQLLYPLFRSEKRKQCHIPNT